MASSNDKLSRAKAFLDLYQTEPLPATEKYAFLKQMSDLYKTHLTKARDKIIDSYTSNRYNPSNPDKVKVSYKVNKKVTNSHILQQIKTLKDQIKALEQEAFSDPALHEEIPVYTLTVSKPKTAKKTTSPPIVQPTDQPPNNLDQFFL